MNFGETYWAFRDFEDNCNVFTTQIQGVHFWDILRFPIFGEVLERKGIIDGNSQNKSRHGLLGKVARKCKIAQSLLFHNPFLVKQKDFFFFGPGPSRKKLGADGNYWDIFCDPLIDHLEDESCLLLEPFEYGSKSSPLHTRHFAYTTCFGFLEKLSKYKNLNLVEFEATEKSYVDFLEKSLKERFEIEIDVSLQIKRTLGGHRKRLAIYRKFFSRKRPKAVFLICSYGKEALVDACRQLAIPTIEVQHGTISPYHLGYSYPSSASKLMFPDYFLSFGSFWTESTSLPIDKSKVFTLGSPHLETYLNLAINQKRLKQITFISQWSIGKDLSRFAVELSQKVCPEYKVIYKLHPREVFDWKTKYPWLAVSKVEVLDNEDTNLYKLLAQSEIQIGVYSTAIYEGITLGCKTFLVDLAGIEYMTPLIEKNIVKLVRNPDEIELETNKMAEFNKDYFFAEGWKSNFDSFINHLEKAPYP